MTNVYITYNDGSTEQVYCDWVPPVRDGASVLTLVDVDNSGATKTVPLTSIKHYTTRRV